jgi:hypothetical protein
MSSHDHVLETFRYLRFAMVLLALMLGASVVAVSFATGEVQTSLSAYYWTPARPVFVGALFAVGACLVIYRGNSATEDTILNFAGYLAVVVALVPILPPDANPETWAATGVGSNVAALLAIAVVALVAQLVVQRRLFVAGTGTWAKVMWFVGVAVLAGLAAAFVWQRALFNSVSHYVAAVLLFAGIVGVVLLNARAARPAFRAVYWAVLAAMAACVAATVVLVMVRWPYTVLAVEAALVVLFAVFWGVQTKELWRVVDRSEQSAAPVDPEPLPAVAGAVPVAPAVA